MTNLDLQNLFETKKPILYIASRSCYRYGSLGLFWDGKKNPGIPILRLNEYGYSALSFFPSVKYVKNLDLYHKMNLDILSYFQRKKVRKGRGCL